jgi:ankyrin repeat protein
VVKDLRIDCAQTLLLHGASVNCLSQARYTPAHFAARDNHPVCLNLLIEAKANVDALNDELETPLHNATHDGHAACVRVLLAARCCVDPVDCAGDTPLGNSVGQERVDCALLLLDAGAQLSLCSKEYLASAPWIIQADSSRKRCRATSLTFYGVLRKRIRVPREMAHMIVSFVWNSRFHERWKN